MSVIAQTSETDSVFEKLGPGPVTGAADDVHVASLRLSGGRAIRL